MDKYIWKIYLYKLIIDDINFLENYIYYRIWFLCYFFFLQEVKFYWMLKLDLCKRYRYFIQKLVEMDEQCYELFTK